MQEKIAIVGISVELPAGDWAQNNLDHEAFYRFLLEKGQSYVRIPSERLNIDSWHGKDLGQIVTQHGSFLKDTEAFDNLEFGVSSKDAKLMCPSTRKLIEHCFLALLDAGIDYRSRNVGCFMSGTFYSSASADTGTYNSESSLASAPSMIANRVSYHLDLVGPSVPVDTACSSTGTALHLAVNALLEGDCLAAVVGGSQLNHNLLDWLYYSQGGILSPDGKCKPFDANADGFGRAEGVVAIVVKPLSNALEDGDHIYGTILGSAINSTGSSGPPNAPVAEAQLTAMKAAFRRAGKSPKDVDYVECHATGTAKGDPTEVNWIGKHFHREGKPLTIGSVKGNIGHTEITSFFASLSKVLSIFQYRTIPPSVNLAVKNPNIHWNDFNLHIASEPTPTIPYSDEMLVAMASSGIGGANVHVVLQSHSHGTCNVDLILPRRYRLLSVGGLSPRSTEEVWRQVREMCLTEQCELDTLEANLARRTRQMTWRSFCVVDDTLPLEPQFEFPSPKLCPSQKPPVVFVFPGQGPQYRRMGSEFFRSFRQFRDSVLECDQIYLSRTGESLIKDFGLFDVDDNATEFETWSIRLILPAIAVFQIGLFDLLQSIGIKPDAVIGHSAGETAAFYANGAACKAMAVELAIARGIILSAVSKFGGGMAAIADSADHVKLLVESVNADDSPNPPVEIACYNAPSAVAISGPISKLQKVVDLAKAQGARGTRINTDVPMHSGMIGVCRDAYCRAVTETFERYSGSYKPIVPTCSTLTGQMFTGPYDPEYFWQSSIQPVLFADGLVNIRHNFPTAVFLEIGAHAVLSSYVAEIFTDPSLCYPCALRPKSGKPMVEMKTLLGTAGHLMTLGYNSITFPPSRRMQFPEYPFLKKTFPVYTSHALKGTQFRPRNGPLNHPFLRINKQTHPSLAQHITRGEAIMPAAGYLEMALEFGATALFEVNMRSIFSLNAENPIKMQVHLDGCYWSVSSVSEAQSGSGVQEALQLHADGYLSFEPISLQMDALNIPEIISRCKEYNSTEFYSSLHHFLQYGPLYQRVEKVFLNAEEAIVLIRGRTEDLREEPKYILQPAILDAAFHVTVFPHFSGNFDPNTYYLPSKVSRLVLSHPPRADYFPEELYAHCRFVKWEPDSVTYDITITDGHGHPLCFLDGFNIAKHRANHVPSPSRAYDIVYEELYRMHISREKGSANGSARLSDICRSITTGVTVSPHGSVLPKLKTLISNGAAAPSDTPLFDPDPDHLLFYAARDEMALQWHLSGLELTRPETIWIVTEEGRAADESRGLSRTLRREFPAWTIRLVVFLRPSDDQFKINCIKGLPSALAAEEELIISETGSVYGPRLVEVDSDHELSTFSPSPSVQNDSIPVLVEEYVAHENIFAFIGRSPSTLEIADASKNPPIFGITKMPASDVEYVSHGSVIHPKNLAAAPTDIARISLGLVIAAIAVSPSTLLRPTQTHSLRILLTHSDTAIGRVLSRLYKAIGATVITVGSDLYALQLSKLGHHSFDVVLSATTERTTQQLLNLLTRHRTGKTFFWNDSQSGLLARLDADPGLLRDAFLAAETAWITHKCSIDPESHVNGYAVNAAPMQRKALFTVNELYLLVGGTGSLGLQIGLWMYFNGARHFMLISRSGELHDTENTGILPHRILNFLQSREGVTLNIQMADASDDNSLRALLSKCTMNIGGCFILTTQNADGIFMNLGQEEFDLTRNATYKVVQTLEKALRLDELKFVVMLSSVSAMFGNGGQSNYASAKSAADGVLRGHRNALCMVCPPIAGTQLVQGIKNSKNDMKSWAISIEQFLAYLKDGLLHLFEGKKFFYYIPDLDWPELARTIGPSPLFTPLLPEKAADITGGDATIDSNTLLFDIILQHVDVVQGEFDPNVPLVSYGLDSFSASRLSFALQKNLAISVTQIQLLANMTATDLVQRGSRSLQHQDGTNELESLFDAHLASMEELLAQFGHFKSSPKEKLGKNVTSESRMKPNGKKVVLVTGTTGQLGCHILAQLVQSPDVARVVAFNRSSSNDSFPRRQIVAFETEGILLSLAESTKVQYLEYDSLLSDTDGEKLAALYYDDLSSVTDIIHNAWRSDFTSPVSSYNDLLGLTRFLILLATGAEAKASPSFSFISSVSVAGFCSYEYAADERPISIKELKAISDPELYHLSGYLQSKLVAEAIIQEACTQRSLKAGIIRMGQLCGNRANGAWRTSQWFPAMVKSCSFVGCVPHGDDTASWLYPEAAAKIVLELTESPDGVYHVIHPNSVKWSSIAHQIAQAHDAQMPMVSYQEWFKRLSQDANDAASTQRDANPAIKLMEFFRQGLLKFEGKKAYQGTESLGFLPRVSMSRSKVVSKTLRESVGISPLDESDIQRWMDYWRKVGFL